MELVTRPPNARKVDRDFYERPASDCATDFLGKVLVRRTPSGRVAGVIRDVEAYPAFSDDVHHGNKKTPRTAVMWEAGGVAYVYLIYGMWH
jgi:DNA-3-methyladenine glycosylase